MTLTVKRHKKSGRIIMSKKFDKNLTIIATGKSQQSAAILLAKTYQQATKET